MDDEFNIVDMHAAGGDVGGDQNPSLARGEGSQIALTGRLGQVAVQVHRWNTRLSQLTGQLARLMFGAQEQDSPRVATGQPVHQVFFRFDAVNVKQVMGHQRGGRSRFRDGPGDRVVEEAFDQRVDRRIQGCRKEHPLSARGRRRQDSGDAGQEAEVGEVVCLIDHGDPHRIKLNDVLLHQVAQPPWAGDDDVDARLQRTDLAVLRDATEDRRHPQAPGLRQGFDGRGDLIGQFTRGREH